MEVDIERRCARGHVNVEREHVHRIAHPFHARAIGVNHEARKLVDSSRGGVIAGQPLGIQEHDGLAGAHRNGLVNAEDMPVDIGGVHTQTDRAEVRSVLRSGNLRRHGQGLRSRRLCETTACAQHESAPNGKDTVD